MIQPKTILTRYPARRATAVRDNRIPSEETTDRVELAIPAAAAFGRIADTR
jgi:hypothetical protein